MRIARPLLLSLLLSLCAVTVVTGPALAEDQLYQGTECESNSPLIRSSARTVNNSNVPIVVECPAVHNPPQTVRMAQMSGFDGHPAQQVQCTLFTRQPNSGVFGFQTQSTPIGFVGFFTLFYGAVPSAATTSVGFFCHIPAIGAQGLSTLNQYFVREL